MACGGCIPAFSVALLSVSAGNCSSSELKKRKKNAGNREIPNCCTECQKLRSTFTTNMFRGLKPNNSFQFSNSVWAVSLMELESRVKI